MVGRFKRVDRVCPQTVIDCFCCHAWGRLFTNKMPVTAAQTLNYDVLSTFEEHGARIDGGIHGRTPWQACREGIVQSATEKTDTGTDEPQVTAA